MAFSSRRYTMTKFSYLAATCHDLFEVLKINSPFKKIKLYNLFICWVDHVIRPFKLI